MQSHFEPHVTFSKLKRKQSSPHSAKTYQVEPEQRLQQLQQIDLLMFAPFLLHLAQQLCPPLFYPSKLLFNLLCFLLESMAGFWLDVKFNWGWFDAGVPECFGLEWKVKKPNGWSLDCCPNFAVLRRRDQNKWVDTWLVSSMLLKSLFVWHRSEYK